LKIDWKQKLSSRRLWFAVAGWLTSVLTAFNVSDNTIVQVTLLVSGFGSLVVYILGESIVDASAKKNNNENKEE